MIFAQDEQRRRDRQRDTIQASTAFHEGLYNRVVEDDELQVAAEAMAATLARGPGMGIAITKRMLNAEAHMSLSEAMQVEGWVQAECMKHPDYRESYDAFVAKRE